MMTYFYDRIRCSLRFVILVSVCALLLVINAVPAMAAGMTSPSKPSDGETQLQKIYDESEKSLNSGLDSMKEVSERAQRGVNEVQGGADLDKMNNPENSQDATTFKEQVKKALEKVTPDHQS